MAFKKGDPKPPGSGRKKGQLSTVTVALKDMILGALADAGGQSYLTAQAKKNPAIFCSLVGRVLPLQIKDGGADPMVPKPVYHDHLD